VTIAGGMVCADGVILCADTEWTASTLKIQRQKHWRIETRDGSLRLAVAGAGVEDLVEFALQRLQAQITENQSLTIKDVYDGLQSVLNYVYREHVYPIPRWEDNDFGLLLAVYSAQDNRPVLFKTANTTILSVDSYVYLGVGREFASYLTQKMFMNGMPLEVATYLASYVLWETKQHVQTCGGDSIIYRLKNDGTMQYLGYGEIRDYETHFDDFDRTIQRLRLQTVNLELEDVKFERTLSDFAEEARLFRAARQVKDMAEKKIDDERFKRSASRKLEQGQ
jgi:20S proteasome alpha/beta subunit